MRARTTPKDRRRWSRLPLAIPVFVRTRDQNGHDSLEFATALNVSAGGMLLAVRRFAEAERLNLEIPSAPLPSSAALPAGARTLLAKTVRVTPSNGYYLLGLKFLRPLASANKPAPKRKFISSV